MAQRMVAARRSAAERVVYDEGLRAFLSNVLITMAGGLAVTGAVAYAVLGTPDTLGLFLERGPEGLTLSWLWWGMTIAEFALVFWIISWASDGKVSFAKGVTVFALYSALNGCTIAPVLSLYTGASVAKVFFITASVFGACALWGHTTKRDITHWGSFLIMGLIGLLIAMLTNLVLRSPMVDFLVTGVGVLIFMALTAWDMQMFRRMYDESGHTVALVINAALTLYLDFINLFLMFMRVFGAPSVTRD